MGAAGAVSRLPPVSRLDMGKRLEGDTVETATQIDQRDVSCHTMLCSAVKAQGKEEQRGTFVVTTFFFSSNCYVWGSH